MFRSILHVPHCGGLAPVSSTSRRRQLARRTSQVVSAREARLGPSISFEFFSVTEEAVSKSLSKPTPSREMAEADATDKIVVTCINHNSDRLWHTKQDWFWPWQLHKVYVFYTPWLQVTGERDWDLAWSWLVPGDRWHIPLTCSFTSIYCSNILQYHAISIYEHRPPLPEHGLTITSTDWSDSSSRYIHYSRGRWDSSWRPLRCRPGHLSHLVTCHSRNHI